MKVQEMAADRQAVYEKAAPILPNVAPRAHLLPIPRQRLLVWLARLLAILGLVLGVQQVFADEDVPSLGTYRLGEGYRLGDTGFTLGGYATVTSEDLRHAPSRTALDNTSLFVWWEGEGRWKFFSEIDYENVWSNRSAVQEGDKRYLALERLYFDYAYSDNTNVRIGKFLTPIGRWNLIHATPLVWTTSRPLITTLTFPGNVTGVLVNGSLPRLGNGIEYSIYGSAGGEIRPNPTLDPFNEVIGGHVSLPLSEDGQIGFSYAAFEQKKTRGEQKQLAGVDFVWSRHRFEISGEGIYRFSDNGSTWDEKGAFVQLVAPLSERLYAVGRYEIVRKAREIVSTKLWVAGLNYRISRALVLKAEWVGSKDNQIDAPEGFMSSLSVLF
jgi:hypothetical protein